MEKNWNSNVFKNRYWSIISDEIFFRPEHVQFNGIFRRNAGFRVAITASSSEIFIFWNSKHYLHFFVFEIIHLRHHKNKLIKQYEECYLAALTINKFSFEILFIFVNHRSYDYYSYNIIPKSRFQALLRMNPLANVLFPKLVWSLNF